MQTMQSKKVLMFQTNSTTNERFALEFIAGKNIAMFSAVELGKTAEPIYKATAECMRFKVHCTAPRVTHLPILTS